MEEDASGFLSLLPVRRTFPEPSSRGLGAGKDKDSGVVWLVRTAQGALKLKRKHSEFRNRVNVLHIPKKREKNKQNPQE